jgi:hypothetical protein
LTNVIASISSAFLLSKAVGSVRFQEVVKESSGFIVIPFDATDELEKDLMRTLNNTLSNS